MLGVTTNLKDGTAVTVTAPGVAYRHRQGSNTAWVRQVPGVTEYMDYPRSFPSQFRSVREAVRPVSWTQNQLNRGQRLVVAPEFMVGLGAGSLFAPAPPPVASANISLPWIVRDSNFVPTDPAAPVTVLSVRVPYGRHARLHSYSFDLRPSVLFEENYVWRIYAAGRDLLNAYGEPLPGRPIRQAVPVPFGPEDGDLPVFPGGTLIEVVVAARLPIVATDTIAATIQAALFG